MTFLPPERDDEANARYWRGSLFGELVSPLMWKDKWLGYFETLKSPKSVTFPICQGCNHIIWEWPHFEEPVPENAICDQCEKDMEEDFR